jgi:hypothetical protein
MVPDTFSVPKEGLSRMIAMEMMGTTEVLMVTRVAIH